MFFDTDQDCAELDGNCTTDKVRKKSDTYKVNTVVENYWEG